MNRSLACVAVVAGGCAVAGPVCHPEWLPTFNAGGPTGTVGGVAIFDEDGAGPGQPSLFVVGRFVTVADQSIENIARWRDGQWTSVGEGLRTTLQANFQSVDAFSPNQWHVIVFDADGEGPQEPALYATGSFQEAGELLVGHIARWDGESWQSVGYSSGLTSVFGTPPGIEAMVAHDSDDDGPESASLYVSGTSLERADGVEVHGCARWDGVVWSPVSNFGTRASAFARFDVDGASPGPSQLLAGGRFALSDGQVHVGIARLASNGWEPIGEQAAHTAPYDPTIRTMAVFDPDDDGPVAPVLFIGGQFTSIGGVASRTVARWDGATWSPCDAGLPGDASTMGTLFTFDPDGHGPQSAQLFGYLATLDLEAQLYEWDGAEWGAVDGPRWFGSAFGALVQPLAAVVDDAMPSDGPSLFIGGLFRNIGLQTFNTVGEQQGCGPNALACAADVNGDGVVGFADLNAVVGRFNTTDCGSGADIDGDCDIDFADLNYVLGAYHQTCP